LALVYDAFGRLVRVLSVEGMDETDVAIYRYNGLNMRLMWQDDADADSTLESSERFYVAHDERWRPVATFRDTDATPKEAFAWHAAGPSGFGGSSYIDSIILRDRDNYTGGSPNPMTSASDGTLEERRYYCQNWRADVVAVTKPDGTPLEYVRYSSYGEPTVYPVADLNMDGVVNSSDVTEWSNLIYSSPSSAVYADSDLDWDGLDDWNSGGADGDLFAESYNANTGLSGVGRVSSAGVANRVGYAGYQWDQTISACHVRYRVYLPDIGRWTRRDPLGYVDGMGLYEYVSSMAISLFDPLGLSGDGGESDEIEDIERRMREIEEEKKRLRRERPGSDEDHRRIRDRLKELDERFRQLKAQRKSAKDQLKRNPRIPGKGDYGRNDPRAGKGSRGRRGFIGQGTGLGIMMSGFYLLHEGADLLGDAQSRCNRYFHLLNDCAAGESCSYAEIDALGRECASEIAERLGKETWYSFTVFHDRVLEALREGRTGCAP